MAKVYGFNRKEDISRVGRVVRRVEGGAPSGDGGRAPGRGGDFGRVLVTKLTEDASQGSLGTCEIWDDDDQASFSATGQTIEVYFRLGDGGNGDWVYAVETVRGYEALNTVCSA